MHIKLYDPPIMRHLFDRGTQYDFSIFFESDFSSRFEFFTWMYETIPSVFSFLFMEENFHLRQSAKGVLYTSFESRFDNFRFIENEYIVFSKKIIYIIKVQILNLSGPFIKSQKPRPISWFDWSLSYKFARENIIKLRKFHGIKLSAHIIASKCKSQKNTPQKIGGVFLVYLISYRQSFNWSFAILDFLLAMAIAWSGVCLGFFIFFWLYLYSFHFK